MELVSVMICWYVLPTLLLSLPHGGVTALGEGVGGEGDVVGEGPPPGEDPPPGSRG